MYIKDVTFESPQENLLYDNVLLHMADKVNSQEYLRFWESAVSFIVLGRISKEQDDVHQDNVIRDKIPVLRRSSGGGTVVQGKGCLNFSLILSKLLRPELVDLKNSYRYILDKFVMVFKKYGIETKVMPISDIALMNNKKFSGNAQKRGRNFILHHGTILYNFNIDLISEYLLIPENMPDYREGRLHSDFVGNIALGRDKIKQGIMRFFLRGIS